MIALSKTVHAPGSNNFAAPERKQPRPASNTIFNIGCPYFKLIVELFKKKLIEIVNNVKKPVHNSR